MHFFRFAASSVLWLSLACLLHGTGLTTASRAAAADESLTFENHVRPILAAKCGKCHSDQVQKAALDLSSMAGLRRGGESGEPLLAESLDESLLWLMIDGGDMPPEGEPPLTDAERTRIHDWLAGGARALHSAHPEEETPNQHDVLPIVLLRCTACHGPQRQDGGLDLRTPAAMLQGGNGGPALVPGDPDASPMIQRIESQACPPSELLLKFFVRRPPQAEVETLRRWIAAGAPVEDIQPDVATTQPDPLVTDEDRRHWAFQPPVAPAGDLTLDDFIQRELREHDLDFSPEADRDTLIRRAYLDLLGLPPGREEWKTWRESDDPDWYRQMIDALLASPRYGERWGRYWLDLAGYADSEGGVSSDPVREVAWKYRDYVIRSFNEDKPYDRFLREQLAGDELLDYEQAAVVTEQMVENLVATGFLRMGIDQTGSRTMNFVPERLGVIDDAITIVGEGLMGMTLGCARCHSHKYDAIPHRDYYRFKAIFQGALDEHDWLSFRNRSLEVAVPERRERVAEVNPPLRAQLRKLQSEHRQAIADLRLELLKQHYPEQPEADRRETLRALGIADNNRTLPQRILVEMLQRVEVLPDDAQPQPVLAAHERVEQLEEDIARIEREMEPPLEIRALWDRGAPSPTYILRRGEHNKPGDLVGPGVPSVLTDGRTPFEVQPPFPAGTPKTGRRLALARWLTRPDHPLTARVMVNRIWYHHFGTGLVKTLENFGVQGERPSHPELLDWLAVQFVERGWSVKEMHRLIMNSRTYRQSSHVTDERLERDPQNRLLSRMTLRRLNAEALRDSLLLVSGKLDETAGGPPDRVEVDRSGLVTARPGADGRFRRSVYLRYRRTEVPTLMQAFDYPEMGPNCLSRTVSTVSTQSLMLMHNRRVRELAGALAERVEMILNERREEPAENAAQQNAAQHDTAQDTAQDDAARVELVYHLALSRWPTAEETALGTETLRRLRAAWKSEPSKALETYCHTILNSAAFLYVD